MSKELWLLIDTPYLCYRAMYTTGGLTHDGAATGVVYGLLRDVRTLTDRFGTENVVFCFDHGQNLRKTIDPEYKANRDESKLDPKKKRMIADMREQVQKLKTEYLFELGYTNVAYCDGYEADDVIADLAHKITSIWGERCMVVSGDKDLYQLLEPSVRCYDPKSDTVMTASRFRTTYGIYPHQWATVKAISGCPSDNVKGVGGVGEKTAIKYVRGLLSPTTKASRTISANHAKIAENLKLVKLPLRHPQKNPIIPPPGKNTTTNEQWNQFVTKLGMKSLLQQDTGEIGVKPRG